MMIQGSRKWKVGLRELINVSQTKLGPSHLPLTLSYTLLLHNTDLFPTIDRLSLISTQTTAKMSVREVEVKPFQDQKPGT